MEELLLQATRIAPAVDDGRSVASELKHLWVGILRERWTSLVVVPADRGVSSRAITGPFAELARQCASPAVEVFDTAGVSTDTGERFVDVLTAAIASGSRVIAGIDPLAESLAGVALALYADAILLVVGVGSSELASARRTIESVGRDRIIGCVAIDPGVMAATAPGR